MDENSTQEHNVSRHMYTWQNEPDTSAVQIGLMIVVAVIFIFIILNNGLLVTVVLRHKHLQTPPNIIVLNIAIADLFQGIFGIPIREMMTYEYDIARDITLGIVDKRYVCFLRVFLTLLGTGGALFLFVALAIERFVAIVLPFRYDRWMCKSNTIILSLMSWALLLAITIPAFFGWNRWDVNIQCSVQNTLHKLHNSVILNPLIYACLALTAVLYGKIFWVAKSKRAQIVAQIQAVDHAKAVAYKRDFKILKTVVIILGLFIISWIPLLFVRMVLTRTNLDSATMIILTNITFKIVLVKSAINPMIFCEKDRRLRMAVLKLLRLHRQDDHDIFTSERSTNKSCESNATKGTNGLDISELSNRDNTERHGENSGTCSRTLDQTEKKMTHTNITTPAEEKQETSDLNSRHI
ncbi:unnamed protein product [Owenia fusiformis]|uniref:Uncharacterized protein n=1 Tax=Owenia fusiformis TaxID=6347 RepID=A0A8J1XTM6_OWEFU|nr:unnamed protein product [Owenia fusiformis]